ncbi:MAG TPA: hypothetical protein VN700_17635 [Vicinamibacterales bacterium]|nr:hypothetical protein [Vicinamibacterales bacterium]
MLRRRLLLFCLVAIAVQLVAIGSANQARMSLAGKWIPVPVPPNTIPRGIEGPWGAEVTITQDTYALTIDYVSGGRSHAPVRLIYNFDGTERRVPYAASVAPAERITRAQWREADLVLTTTWPREDPGPVVITDVLTPLAPDSLRVTRTQRFGENAPSASWFFRRAK